MSSIWEFPIVGIPLAVALILVSVLIFVLAKIGFKFSKFNFAQIWRKYMVLILALGIAVPALFGAGVVVPYFTAALQPIADLLRGGAVPVVPPSNEWNLVGKIDVSVNDELGGDTASCDGTYTIFKGQPGQLVAYEAVTVTDGVGTTAINTYTSGDSFYAKMVIGSQTIWFGPITLPKQPQGSQRTTHAISHLMPLIDTTKFSITLNYKGSAISTGGEYNGTTQADDFPVLNFGLYETASNKGWREYFDFEKNWQRQMVVVVRLNNSEADNVLVTAYPTGWTLTNSATNDRYYIFRPGDHLYLWKTSAGEVIDGGSIPFQLGLDLSGVTQGKSIRLWVQLAINSNFNYYDSNNAHPTGYTAVATFIVYIKS